jgi:hypothetical protein
LGSARGGAAARRLKMKTRVLVAAIPFGLLVLGCVDPSYYYSEEDDAASAVTVAPAEAKEAEAATGATAAAATGEKARAFVKALPPNPLAGPDGLERDRDWRPLTWDNPCSASVWKRAEGAADVVLVVGLEGGESDKAGVSRSVSLSFAETGTLRMDVYNPTSRRIPVAFAVFSSVDRVYSESKAGNAGPGWNRLEFDLGASTFKTAASEWRHTAKLWGPEDIVELVILFYDDGADMLAVDRLEVDAEPRAPAADGAI